VAVCSGSGSSLLGDALSRGADVYLSGDLGYHLAREAEAAGIAMVDAGHFGTEHPAVAVLAQKLEAVVLERRWPVTVSVCTLEKDPFVVLQNTGKRALAPSRTPRNAQSSERRS
jgi:putative NIF3 family GTP cyclohydrolase 1 type 2